MTKNLLQSVMLKKTEEVQKPFLSTEDFINKLNGGYVASRSAKHQQKKSFAPSTIAYGHGECPRYWYLAFEGGTFEDYSDAYAVANMTSGTLSHSRIQTAMLNAGLAKPFKDDKGELTTEFKITYQDPPIFGFGDAIVLWEGEELVGEIKTMPSEGFEYRKAHGKPKVGHLIQLLIYMKILGKKRAVLIYENKNNHDLLIIPVEVNDHYRKWVDYAFDWMRTVRKAWEDKTLPTKNYRSNAKVCKTCPLNKVCASAEVGTVKISSLEALSETL